MENILFYIAIKRNTKLNVGNKPPTYIVDELVSPLKLNPMTNILILMCVNPASESTTTLQSRRTQMLLKNKKYFPLILQQMRSTPITTVGAD